MPKIFIFLFGNTVHLFIHRLKMKRTALCGYYCTRAVYLRKAFRAGDINLFLLPPQEASVMISMANVNITDKNLFIFFLLLRKPKL